MDIKYLNAILETGIAILEHKLQNPRTGRMVNPRYLRKLTHNLRVHRYTYNPAPPAIQPLPMVGALAESEKSNKQLLALLAKANNAIVDNAMLELEHIAQERGWHDIPADVKEEAKTANLLTKQLLSSLQKMMKQLKQG